jgi:hypothetical protein
MKIKNFLSLLPALLLFASALVFAQGAPGPSNYPISMQVGSGTPSGTCPGPNVEYLATSSQALYICPTPGGSWVQVGGSGGGVTSFNTRTGAVVPVSTDYTSLTALATANNGTGGMTIGAPSTGTVSLSTAAGGNVFLTSSPTDNETISIGPYNVDPELTGGIVLQGSLGSGIQVDDPAGGIGSNGGGDWFFIPQGGLFELDSSGSSGGDIPFLFTSTSGTGKVLLTTWMDQATFGLGLPGIIFAFKSSALTANAFSGSARNLFSNTPPGADFEVEVAGVQAIIVAGTSSSTFPSLTLSWTDPGSVARTATLVATSTTNTTAVLTSFFEPIHVKGGTNPTLTSASYASSGATAMKYTLAVDSKLIQ